VTTPQLPLGLRLPAHRGLERYEPGACGDNRLALAAASAVREGGFARSFGLVGPAGVGKSHLLMAACQGVSGRNCQYLSFARLGDAAEAALVGIPGDSVVALDDLDALAGRRDAEIALFDLYNRVRAANGTFLFGARRPPAQLPLDLPDLMSRLSALTLYALRPLAEPERRALLRREAGVRGIELTDEVIDFLFRRHPRDVGAMLVTLDAIDRESLAAQRRVTVPFVRRLMGWPSRAPSS
jgi:DnaA family protein